MLPIRDKLRAICHQLKLRSLSSIVDERKQADVAYRIKRLPPPESILTMPSAELEDLRGRLSRILIDIESGDTSRTHDGYVFNRTMKNLPPRRAPILPTRDWYAIASAEKMQLKFAEDKEYSWVFVKTPEDITKKIVQFGEQIDPEDLLDSEGLEKEPHITVMYGLLTDDLSEVKEAIEGAKSGSVKLFDATLFENDDCDVVKIEAESKTLTAIHKMLNKLENDDSFPTYKAHATIAYVKKGKGSKYEGKFSISDSFEVTEVFFGYKDRDKSPSAIPLAAK